MGGGSLEYKSKEKFKNSGKIILDYNDFFKAKKGDYLALSMSGNYDKNKLSENLNFPNCTTTFFVKREIIDENKQKVSLKHHYRTSSRLYKGKKPSVVDYILPRTGKLELIKFKEGEIKKDNLKLF
jgi:hypothetical protein